MARREDEEILTIRPGEKCERCGYDRCPKAIHPFAGKMLCGNCRIEMGEESGPRIKHFGERNGKTRITTAKVVDMRAKYAKGDVTQEELARELGISRPSVANILARRRWGHVP